MTDSHKLKNRVIFTLLFVILVMVTAIVVLAYNYDQILKPGDSSSGSDGRWRVEFTSIREVERNGKATSRFKPYYVGTNAYFHVDFVAPGDFMTYEIQVSNLGTVDAKLEDIIYVTEQYRDAIRYDIIGLNEGQKLKAGKSYNFKVRVRYILHSNIVDEFDDPITIKLNYVQDN